MKDGIESAAVGRAPEPQQEFTNRKLIRPSLGRPDRPNGDRRFGLERKPRVIPAEQTHAENFYYQKQMQSRTPMVVTLKGGETIEGIIEWYDRNCIKLHRNGQADVLVYKSAVKYIYKAGENHRAQAADGRR